MSLSFCTIFKQMPLQTIVLVFSQYKKDSIIFSDKMILSFILG